MMILISEKSNFNQNLYSRYLVYQFFLKVADINSMGDIISTASLIIANLQIFSDYQMQQMSDNFIDSFGFNDEEFNEGDDGGG